MKTAWPLTLALAFLMTGTAFGGGHEFDRLVRAIESHYGTRHTSIPFMGWANLFVKVSHPDGAAGFHLAVFENLKSTGDEWAERDRFIESLSDGLRPLVRTKSRRNGECSYILAGASPKSTQMLLVTFSRDEATAMQVKFDGNLFNWAHEH
jgi:hypothetical protein